MLPLVLATLLVGGLIGAVVFRDATSPERVPTTRRFALDLPWQTMSNWGDFRVRVSPQGTHIAYPGSDEVSQAEREAGDRGGQVLG